MKLRYGTRDDVARLVEHNLRLADETEGKTLDKETVHHGVMALFGERNRGFYMVAERDGEVVGQLMITKEWSDWRNGDFWWIQSVYVRKEARRQGVYRALHDHVITEAHTDPDVCGVRLYAAKANAEAQATYLALGMKHAAYEMFEVDFVLDG